MPTEDEDIELGVLDSSDDEILLKKTPKQITRAYSKSDDYFHSVVSICTYSFCSISVLLLNKHIVHNYDTTFGFSLIFLQNLTGLLMVIFARAIGIVTFPKFKWSTALAWLPITVFFVIMLESSVLTLTTMSVPVFTVVKNFATVFIALGELFFFHKSISGYVYVTFAVMTVGSLFAVYDNVFVTPQGVIMAGINVLSTVCYLLYMKKCFQDSNMKDLGQFGPVFYNNLTSLPPLVFFMFYFEVTISEVFGDIQGIISVFMLLIMGALLSFTTVYCIKKNSATTYSMTGAVNKVPTTLLGAVAFRQYPSFLASIGIVVSIIGGAGYAFFKAREDHQEKRHELETVSVAVTSKIPYTTLRDRSDSTSRDKPR